MFAGEQVAEFMEVGPDVLVDKLLSAFGKRDEAVDVLAGTE